ncbi:unnamed protein product, partial [Polarella glacialis]
RPAGTPVLPPPGSCGASAAKAQNGAPARPGSERLPSEGSAVAADHSGDARPGDNGKVQSVEPASEATKPQQPESQPKPKPTQPFVCRFGSFDLEEPEEQPKQ